jgi:integration host factor subunit beta
LINRTIPDRHRTGLEAASHEVAPRFHIRTEIEENEAMNKAELVEALRKKAGLTRVKAEEVVELFFNQMSDALARGDKVEIRGLCSFHVKEYRAYAGRNPKTGEKIQVAPKKLPFFKCGKELKEMVDYNAS